MTVTASSSNIWTTISACATAVEYFRWRKSSPAGCTRTGILCCTPDRPAQPSKTSPQTPPGTAPRFRDYTTRRAASLPPDGKIGTGTPEFAGLSATVGHETPASVFSGRKYKNRDKPPGGLLSIFLFWRLIVLI